MNDEDPIPDPEAETARLLADPELAAQLLEKLPDVRDGLNKQQRNLLHTMHRLGAFHDRHPVLTARICGWADDRSLKTEKKTVRTRLKEVRFSSDGSSEEYYTPDLFE